MASFTQTTGIKHPMQDYAPHLETGTKLGYGLKIYRGYASIQLANTQSPLIDVETGSAIILPLNTAIVGMSIKSKEATLDGGYVFYIQGVTTTGVTTQLAGGITTASVNLGVGCCYYSLATSVQPISAISASAPYIVPVIYTGNVGGNSSVANTVYVTLVVMEISP